MSYQNDSFVMTKWKCSILYAGGCIDIHAAPVTHRSGAIISLTELRSTEKIKSEAAPNSQHAPQENGL